MRIPAISLIIFAVFLAAAIWLSGIRKGPDYYERCTQDVGKVLAKKEEATMAALRSVAENLLKDPNANLFSTYEKRQEELLKEEDISIYAYYNDSLIFWTSSYISVPTYSFDEDFLFDVIKLKNGWYRLIKFKKGDLLLLGLIQIQSDYFINNKFLVDELQEDFRMREECRIITQEGATRHEVRTNEGNYLFGLIYMEEDLGMLKYTSLGGVFYLMALLSYLFFLYSLRYISFFQKRPLFHIILFFLVVLASRYLNLRYNIPGVLYTLEIFDPQYFASSFWLPSLGDFIINALLLTALLGLIFERFIRYKPAFRTQSAKYFTVFIFGIISACAAWGSQYLIKHLIYDSKISFDLANLLVLDIFSFLGFSLITLILFDYLLVILFFSRAMARSRSISVNQAAIASFVPFAIIGVIEYFTDRTDILSLFFPYLIYVAVIAFGFRRKPSLSFYTFAPTILLFTLFSTYLLFTLNDGKEKDQRQVLAFKIADEQDHVAEFLFIEAEEKLKNDQIVRQLLFDNASQNEYSPELFNRIAQNYFGGYWAKYALQIVPFTMGDYAVLNDSARADRDLLYYENSIEFNGSRTASPDLFFIDNNYGKVNYIARIELSRQLPEGTETKVIFIEFISKIVTQITGFPELLLDDKITKPVDISGYSYAIYKSDKLTVSGGNFGYPLTGRNFITAPDEISYSDIKGYSHLFYRTPSGKVVVVSHRVLRWQEFLSPFAYLLIYFSSIMFLFFVYRYLFLNDNNSLRFNFKTRIQLSILSILLISLVVVGLGINNYVVTQFNRKNKLTLNEKLNSILLELKGQMAENRFNAIDGEFLTYLLQRYSNIFFTDINFYSRNGTLIASSRESVYNEGLLSRQLDPTAFTELSQNLQPSYIHMEKIGRFEYLSAYATFRNNNNEIVGYLNLPYFLRQKELKEELASSLLALINIYSLLITVSMIVTFIIANRLTEPLTVLQEKIGQIRLGRKNEQIDYNANDEIGSLVGEYNRMIKELEQSADLLARSERESAWREMAKQVAHEVKNPLTPMKLSVQYLIKAWEDKRPDFDERLHKFRNAMIEQIETLSAIASEFSYFAKMPAAIRMEMDLAELLRNCIEFYRNNEYSVIIRFENRQEGPAIIMADKDQVLRVFNNLLRNSIQAIPEDRKGAIMVSLAKDETGDFYIVTVRDNGSGIPEDFKDKIFAPNFTTKSSGMGLGLAMARTIIENTYGEISYETVPDEGTTFYVKIPAHNP